MKLLIVGTPRSGTTSLIRGIGNQGFFKYGEPFNPVRKGFTGNYNDILNDLNTTKNIVVKCLCEQIPIDTKYYPIDPIDFYRQFAKKFDRVILLDRSDMWKHKQSMVFLIWRLVNKKSVHSRWTWDEIPNKFKKEEYPALKWEERLLKQKKDLIKLSDYIDIPIIYYENLYSKDRVRSLNIIKSWDLPIDPYVLNEYLDPLYKLKQDKKTII